MAQTLLSKDPTLELNELIHQKSKKKRKNTNKKNGNNGFVYRKDKRSMGKKSADAES